MAEHSIVNLPRKYQNLADLAAMKRLLTQSRAVQNGAYAIHPGDLDWWLFYLPVELSSWENIFLWDDPDRPGELAAWAYLSPGWSAFDLFIHPDWRSDQQIGSLNGWTIQRLEGLLQTTGAKQIRTLWVSPKDQQSVECLEKHGFQMTDVTNLDLERPMVEPIPEIELPGGFQIRPLAGESELAQRAIAQHAAFGSSLELDRYTERYRRFMHSAAYADALDLVVMTPEKQVAAFSIWWLDPANRLGHLEPLGTHPSFQRRGLARALILDGLRRMQAAGMTRVNVCTEGDNLPAQALYQATGFQETWRLHTFIRSVSKEE
jgi:ribosomal protein S18 acetylase RimI-like enzyme